MSEAPPPPGEHPAPEITFADIVRLFWKKLREMRTVFQLLFFIAAGALLCALVPQNLEPAEYYQRYGRFLGNIITRLGISHVHTAPWFLLLIAILMLSLVACSGRLWKEASVRWRLPDAAGAQQRLKSPTQAAQSSLAPPDTMAAVAATARRHGYRSFAVATEGQRQVVYLCKHRWSAWGQALAHYAVFLIAIGSLMGSAPGLSVDQQVDIQEGDTYHADDGSLPFDIRVDKFNIARQADAEAVENYYSDVVLLAQGKELARAQISVNRPLRYQGYFVSQSSWSLGEAHIEATVNGKTTPLAFPLARAGGPEMGEESSWGVPQESIVAQVPDGHAAFVATGFFADSIEQNGKIVGRESEYPGRPALNLTFVSGLPGSKAAPGSAMGHRPHGLQDIGWFCPGQALPLPGGGSVKFIGITQVTGLGIRKDNGLPLVWAGFIACMIGLSLIFYVPLRRSLLMCEPRGSGRTTIGMSTYGRATDLAVDDLWTDLLQAVQGTPVESGAAPNEEGTARD